MKELEDFILSVWGAAGDLGDRAAKLATARYRMANAVAGQDEAGNPVEPIAGRVATLAGKAADLAEAVPNFRPADFAAVAKELRELAAALVGSKP